jgi:hypothetical protein
MVRVTFSEWNIWITALRSVDAALHLSNMEYAGIFLYRTANIINERETYGVIY